MTPRKKVYEILEAFKSLPGDCQNMEVKINRHENWTEIRVFGKLHGIPMLRALPIKWSSPPRNE